MATTCVAILRYSQNVLDKTYALCLCGLIIPVCHLLGNFITAHKGSYNIQLLDKFYLNSFIIQNNFISKKILLQL